MKICRLCLQQGAQNIPKSQGIREILKELFPYMNHCLKLSNQQFCDPCLQNIQAFKDLNNSVKSTNAKIAEELKKSQLNKIDLTNLIKTSNGTAKDISICRICLKIVYDSQISLYETEFNFLRYDLILIMFKFCKVMLDCDLSEKPVMCLQCWENLQVCYSFKKEYLEIDKKIRTYCTLFKISVKFITDQVLQDVCQYFLEKSNNDHTEIIDVIKKEMFSGNMVHKKYGLRERIKKKCVDGECNKKENIILRSLKEEYSAITTSKRKRHSFTIEEDEFLLKTYLEITNDGEDFSLETWKQIKSEFKSKFSINLGISTVTNRVKRMLVDKSINNKPTNKRNIVRVKNKTTNKIINIFTPLNPPQESDSDDSFADEVIPSSFTPILKPEPLSDNDEIHIIEPKMEDAIMDLPPSETETDNESLPIPLLERMDLPPLDIQIQETYSVDVKRETLNTVNINGDFGSSVVVDDYKTCKRATEQESSISPSDKENYPPTKRIIWKNQNNETIYKCMQCNFETKYRTSADRHSNWHANPMKKGFECVHCSFKTSKYFLLKHHFSTSHEDYAENDSDDDLPILVPFTI